MGVEKFPAGFEAFWSAYPRKIGKDAAAKAYARRKPNVPLQTIILAAVARQTKWAAWTKDGGQFIPHPSTWLTEGRWKDEEHGTTGQPSAAWAGAA